MAGLGFKDFQVGEVLTSSDVDGYLMQQTVMRFADAGARGSALGTATGTAVPLAEGMVSYLDDANTIEVYDGSAWTAAGVIKQVVQTFKNSRFTTTSTSLVDVTGMTVTITPSANTSKVLILVSGTVGNAGSSGVVRLQLVRTSTNIAISTGGNISNNTAVSSQSASVHSSGLSISFLDSPATASAVTYKLQMAVTANTGELGGSSDHAAVATMTAIEVQG